MGGPVLSLRVKQSPHVWHRLKPPSAPQISWAQNTLLFPLSPPGTVTLCGYICEGQKSQKPQAEAEGAAIN